MRPKDNPLAGLVACMEKGYPHPGTWRECKCGKSIEAPFSVEGIEEIFEEWHKIYGGPEKIKEAKECFFC